MKNSVKVYCVDETEMYLVCKGLSRGLCPSGHLEEKRRLGLFVKYGRYLTSLLLFRSEELSHDRLFQRRLSQGRLSPVYRYHEAIRSQKRGPSVFKWPVI